jgi:hypothetical protein
MGYRFMLMEMIMVSALFFILVFMAVVLLMFMGMGVGKPFMLMGVPVNFPIRGNPNICTKNEKYRQNDFVPQARLQDK